MKKDQMLIFLALLIGANTLVLLELVRFLNFVLLNIKYMEFLNVL